MPSGFFVWETIRCRLDAFLWYAMHTSKEGFSLPKILIVEDELPIADLIRLTLKSAGYLCDHAPDGDQAADLAAAGNYDLALVGVMLPRTDGFTLLEYFQSLELPVIFVTARSAVADRVKGLKLGAPFMNGSGAENWPTAAKPWTCTSSVCGKKWAGKRRCRL